MESIEFRLPDYEVIIHIKVSEFSKHLEKEIESLTATFDLLFHWTIMEGLGGCSSDISKNSRPNAFPIPSTARNLMTTSYLNQELFSSFLSQP